MNQEQYAKANATIELLATAYPQTFFVYEQRRKPLKINIHLDLAGVMEPDELNLALGMYTRNTGYLCNLREGVERIDLSGNPVDMVTAEQAVGAAGRVKARMRRKLETARARKEANRSRSGFH